MSSTAITSDMVIIRDLRTSATVGPDRWGKIRSQPITLSVYIEVSLTKAGRSDDVADSIHYGHLAKDFSKLTNGATFVSLLQLAEAVATFTVGKDERVRSVEVDAYAENQFLQAEHLGVHIRRTRDGVAETEARDDRTIIGDLRVTTIIGVNPPERKAKQNVLLNLTFYGFNWGQPAWNDIHATLVKSIESTSYFTLEAFVTEVARVACSIDGANVVTVRAQKPSALTVAHSSGVEITRFKSFFTT
ncbi:hypothetical protein PILCRDRAFT_16194 [Piloderma croceum F 1598]|uniref:dihydroneopterin aldolase n=1 Tax=Piloderma croceum (strain F 1598) TaxID=765440 RepID=A0A0C3EX73_PILCF|nr:hypothetical protein PILCRDRAFT_16194 [Piloderma croceum F 1598]